MSHNTPTTYLQRFGDAMNLLCGTRPSDNMLQAWIHGTSEKLQEFSIEFGPEWAQGIAVIDAARVMADQPTEGVDHEFLPEVEADETLRERMHNIIGQHLTGLYACTRVWEAWTVGTMSADDFVPASETELADELADALAEAINGASA